MSFLQNPWLIGSIILLGLWALIWFFKPHLRKEMLWMSLFTSLLGLTEPIFVPEYWNPPSLFDLASLTGFDIESLLFSFAIGGIGAVIYEAFIKLKHKPLTMREMHSKRHRFHRLALITPVLVFVPLFLFSGLNPIYTSIIALFAGAFASIYCRPDLKKNMLVGGTIFLSIYFFFFLILNLMFPDFVSSVWNFSTISGILIFGIPLEELLFAFSFGMLWSGFYEHFFWKKTVEKT